MSKAILEVDMPRNCYECELIGQFYDDEHEEYYEACRVSLTRVNSEWGKLINCPLIESRPQGKWKHLGETIKAVTLEMHQCSECGYVVLTRSEFNQESYCPNCGTDMRGGE